MSTAAGVRGGLLGALGPGGMVWNCQVQGRDRGLGHSAGMEMACVAVGGPHRPGRSQDPGAMGLTI